jgi:hypothetical protein
VVLDRHVLAFDIASVIEAFAERDRKARGGIGRPVSDKRDHRQRQPLPTRSKGPRDCGTAEERDELAPLHVPSARITLYAGLKRYHFATRNVRFGSKADMCSAQADVR